MGRREHAAGKGDEYRSVNQRLYDLGWTSVWGETEEIRAAAQAEWTRLKKEQLNAENDGTK